MNLGFDVNAYCTFVIEKSYPADVDAGVYRYSAELDCRW